MTEVLLSNVKREATIFTRHIIGEAPTEAATALYIRAIKLQSTKLDTADRKLLKLILEHPRTTAYIDAGLAFIKPHSEVRHRLYLMFAILESTPEFTRFFLPINRSPWYTVAVAGIGVRSIIRLLVGIAIIKAVAR